ncbi:MAG: sugar phosphate nucleotidyltransferase [bacterium]|nr:sugar phosphate nucleotidyltransferase [bacterium]
MKAILPVAGKGTRLRPLAHTYPKALIPIAGRPMIDWILDPLVRAGLEEAVFIVGWLGAEIEEHVRRQYSGLRLRFVPQGEMLGLGHAIHLGLDEGDGEVFIVLGDTLFEADVAAIRAAPHSVLGVKEVSDPRRFGVAELADGRIVRLVEKPAEPRSNLALIGLYNIKDGDALRRTLSFMIRDGIKTRGEYQITDALQQMIDQGHVFEPWGIEGWFDCGKKETLLATNRHFLDQLDKRREAVRSGDSLLIPPVHLGEGVKLSRSIIGPNVSVGDGASIRDAVIEDSLLCEGVRLEGVVLKDAVLGRDAMVRQPPRALHLSDNTEVDG